MLPYNLIKNLLIWYKNNARKLPWRNTRDPYKIWLSEIILQQTRVNQGLPYYLDFLKKFPTLKSLALASENEVLRLWQGLGYYTRARNLHKCAKIIEYELGGSFPGSYSGLIKLPGIGPYTAAAIASFAFHQPVAAVDGNALRVYTRLFGIKESISSSATVTKVRQIAGAAIPEDSPGQFNQAIMELGANICLPRQPKCSDCPMDDACFAFQNNAQQELPLKNHIIKAKRRYFNYFILRIGGKIVMFKRSDNDIWKGLYDFYLVEAHKLLEPEEISDPFILDSLTSGAEIDIPMQETRHVLSHQIILARFFELQIPENTLRDRVPGSPSLRFYSKNEIMDLPKPVLVNNFLNYYFLNMI